jgi:hypothetical protein
MTADVSGDAFSRALDEALGDAVTMRRSVDTLSSNILHGSPQLIYESAVELENQTNDTRGAVGRLVAILREANHHTLESAYRAMAAAQRHTEAEKLRQLEDEYKRIQATMAASNSHIASILAGLNDTSWHDPAARSDTAGHISGLLAKA